MGTVPEYIYRIRNLLKKRGVERMDGALFCYALAKEQVTEEDAKTIVGFIEDHSELKGERLLKALEEFCEQS